MEFSSSDQYLSDPDATDDRDISDLSKNILTLVTQWIGNENRLLEDETKTRELNEKIIHRFKNLSPREMEVLKLLTQGEPTKSMARILDISTKTVEMHRANLLRKTNAKSSTELVQLTVISGFFDQA